MHLTKEEKGIPGRRRRLFLEGNHKCSDKKRFCRMCLSSHTKEEPCKMRYKKLEAPSQRSKLCYVSFATVSSNFPVECNECYTNKKICQLHHGLKPVHSEHMCNALHTLREVSLMFVS